MTAGELISFLRKLPPETKVLIDSDTWWGELESENVQYVEAFLIWHSGYNGEGTSYVSYSTKAEDSSYRMNNGRDYVRKTIGHEFVVSLL